MRSCKLVGLLLLGALLISPCIARAEEISIPAVEYDISGWEDIWREIQAETGGAAGGASVSDAIARIKGGDLDGLLDLGRIGGLFKEKLKEGVKGMLGMNSRGVLFRGGRSGGGNTKGRGRDAELLPYRALHIRCRRMRVRTDEGGTEGDRRGSSAWRDDISGAYGNDSGSRRQRRIRRAAYLRIALQRHDGGVSKHLHAVHSDDVRAVHGGYGEREQAAQGNGWADKEPFEMGHGADVHLFLGSVSIKSLNAAGLDSAGVKALKYAFDKSVPVVGGVISGTYEGLRAGAIVLKNAAGTVALLLLLLYFTAPGIRMLCSVISMRITAAICAVADDGRISAMLTAAADSCTYMFAVSAIAVLMNMLAVAAALLASGVG